MQIAKRIKQIHPSMTLEINATAQQMRSEGMEIISLAVGEPDFHTPDFVKNAAKRAIDENFTRYTAVAGMAELRHAAAGYFSRYYNANLKPGNIIIGAGGKQCLYTYIMTTINPGDEVLIPSPYWVSYPDMVLLAGGVPVYVETEPEKGFKVQPALLDKKLSSATRLLILNSPCNPTGSVYTQQELKDIVEWCAKNQIALLADEIYDQLVYPPAQMASAISFFHEYPEIIAVANGLSKSFAMTGWRAGFLAACEEVIGKMTQLQSHSLSNISSITQKAALAALTCPDDEMAAMRHAFEKRRDLGQRLLGKWKKASFIKPDGAFYFFVNVRGYYNENLADSVKFCQWLLENAQVATVPGMAFGNDNYMRLSYAVSEETLEKALTQIGNCLTILE